MSFTVTRPQALQYRPGQYARIALQAGNHLIWRPFSFVSTPSDNHLEFLAVIVAGGLFSDHLRRIDSGDTIWVEHENYGFMTPDRFEDGRVLWLLATGTGIGAFLSILRDDRVWNDFGKIILVHGVRRPQQLVYLDELMRMQINSTRHPDRAILRLLACISGQPAAALNADPGSGYRALSARITTALDSGALEAQAGDILSPESSRVMLCGNPAMIEDMRKRLQQRGLTPCRRQKPGQFLTENYW
jgi:ferredoxin/flavodoxin---NADP+ reductase